MKDVIKVDGDERYARDVMNPVGMFCNGKRQRDYSTTNDPLPLSGRLIPEFFGRRNIRDMFSQKAPFQRAKSTGVGSKAAGGFDMKAAIESSSTSSALANSSDNVQVSSIPPSAIQSSSPSTAGKKRFVAEVPTAKTSKRSKSGSMAIVSPSTGKGQQSLKGFFKPKAATAMDSGTVAEEQEASKASKESLGKILQPGAERLGVHLALQKQVVIPDLPASVNTPPGNASMRSQTDVSQSAENSPSPAGGHITQNLDSVHDPVESKESWSKLFTKPAAPRCEGHNEPCITLLTKKPGMNLGRSFWMCPRPLGPSGAKEKNTQWRCQTFIWCSDWNPNSANSE